MFNDSFYTAVGLGNVGDEQKAELTDQLAQIVQNRVALRLEGVLTETELSEFDEAAQKGDEQAFEYLNQVYPDYPLLAKDEIERLKAELSHDVADIAKLLENEGLSET